MKKLHFFFITIMLGVFSCVQQDDNTSSVNATSSEKTLNDVNVFLGKYRNPISLEGHVKVWVNNNHELVAYTETDTHIHLFILQYLQRNINLNENFNSISFLDHSFSLIANSGKNILCQVNNKEESVSASNDLKIISGISNYETILGDGLAHIMINKSELDKSNVDFKYENIKLNNSAYDVFEESLDQLARTGCASGGEGSTSCAITECSVSCSSGYYACCNPTSHMPYKPASCKCIPKAPVLE